jgi:hypothetical protein
VILSVFLLVDTLAVLVFRLIQARLLGLGDVAGVLGFVDRLALGDVRIMPADCRAAD